MKNEALMDLDIFTIKQYVYYGYGQLHIKNIEGLAINMFEPSFNPPKKTVTIQGSSHYDIVFTAYNINFDKSPPWRPADALSHS